MGGGACFATPFVPEHEGKPQLQKKKKTLPISTLFGRKAEGEGGNSSDTKGSTEMR